MKRIAIVNAGPRKGWNTDTLLHEAEGGDTLQLKDYSKTDWPWTLFDGDRKQRRHDEIFPKEKEEVRQLSAKLFR